jgi:hypothetical protein
LASRNEIIYQPQRLWATAIQMFRPHSIDPPYLWLLVKFRAGRPVTFLSAPLHGWRAVCVVSGHYLSWVQVPPVSDSVSRWLLPNKDGFRPVCPLPHHHLRSKILGIFRHSDASLWPKRISLDFGGIFLTQQIVEQCIPAARHVRPVKFRSSIGIPLSILILGKRYLQILWLRFKWNI